MILPGGAEEQGGPIKVRRPCSWICSPPAGIGFLVLAAAWGRLARLPVTREKTEEGRAAAGAGKGAPACRSSAPCPLTPNRGAMPLQHSRRRTRDRQYSSMSLMYSVEDASLVVTAPQYMLGGKQGSRHGPRQGPFCLSRSDYRSHRQAR